MKKLIVLATSAAFTLPVLAATGHPDIATQRQCGMSVASDILLSNAGTQDDLLARAGAQVGATKKTIRGVKHVPVVCDDLLAKAGAQVGATKKTTRGVKHTPIVHDDLLARAGAQVGATQKTTRGVK